MCTVIYWIQYKDKKNIHEFSEQQSYWCNKLRFNRKDKINIAKGGNQMALSNLDIYDTWKNIRKSYRYNKCKIWGTTWNFSSFLNCLRILFNHILFFYHTFRAILNTSSRRMRHWLINYQSKYISVELRTELHSILKLDTMLRF